MQATRYPGKGRAGKGSAQRAVYSGKGSVNRTQFSIVTISFNQAEFLRATIDSVLSQEDADFQYIICDPGSTDGSRELIASYDDARIIRVFEPDDGPADGLNKGFARASGRIFGYLNSDDIFLPGALATAGAFMRANPSADVACGHAHVIDRAGHMLRRVWSEPYWPPAVARGAYVQIQPSTFFRKESFWRSGGFDTEDRSSWDAALLAKMYAGGAKIEIMDAMLSAYRLHSQSITMSGRLKDQQTENLYARLPLVLGRPFRRSDIYIGHALRLMKHLRWPGRATERLLHGPMSGRAE